MSEQFSRRQQPKRTTPINSGRALGPKSPLVNADIQSFLSICMSSWETNYNETERLNIIQTLPIHLRTYEKDETGSLKCPLSTEFVASDEYVKRAIARFQRDIGDGYYEKSWQDKAKKANQERQKGKFDDFIKESIDEMFVSEGDNLNDIESIDGEYGKRTTKKSQSKNSKEYRLDTSDIIDAEANDG